MARTRAETTGGVVAGFRGEHVVPGAPRYDQLRRVFNAMIDRRPRLIARCGDAHDVAAAIAFARAEALPLAVYAGGHSIPGHSVCDDGVVIDLRPMKRIEVDPGGRRCRAQAGVTWAELDAATQAHGLAVTGGRMSSTGIAGFTLGGGSGWLERKLGYAVDNVLSLEVVTADGEVLEASAAEHPQLFWGVRGGGGNFGVVTRLDYRLHPVGPLVLGGVLMYPAEAAPAVLRNFREVLAHAPDEVGAGVALITAPPADAVPAPLRGRPVCGVLVCHAGSPDEGEAALRPLRELGAPAIDMVGPLPYVALQQLLDPSLPPGMRHYMTSDFLSGLPDGAIDALCEHHLAAPSPMSQIMVLPGGGAVARVPADAAAFGAGRRAPFNFLVDAGWADPAADEENIAWAKALAGAMRPFAAGSAYLNFIGDEGHQRVKAAFGPRSYRRLQALKDRYDPDNVFRLNQNIEPSGALADA